MIAIDQSKFFTGRPGSRGDCLSACIASIFGLVLRDTPLFGSKTEHWHQHLQRWADDHGMIALFIFADPDGCMPVMMSTGSAESVYAVANGKSPRGIWRHSVVWEFTGDGSCMLHDPHPSRAGIENVDEFIIFVPKVNRCRA